jgi:hypothetical protein
MPERPERMTAQPRDFRMFGVGDLPAVELLDLLDAGFDKVNVIRQSVLFSVSGRTTSVSE